MSARRGSRPASKSRTVGERPKVVSPEELVVDSNSLAPGEIPVPDWQRALIRDRLAALEEIPPKERSVPWAAVRKRISYRPA